jgi:signal transduction histidine kinase
MASAAALAVAVRWQPPDIGSASTMIASLLAVAVAWLWGRNVRGRRLRFAALEERARRLEAEREERARLAVAEERLRIARELHDVVAHALSVVAVQSGVAHHVLGTRPEAAGKALAVIEATSRDALDEMRRLLGVLRRTPDAEPGALGPAPGLTDLPDLVEQVRSAGLDVVLELPPEVPAAPASLQLSVYRIVQEALTNVLRHGGPSARVALAAADGALTVEVTDVGRPGADPLPAPTGRTDDRATGHGGHGLLGMRERVTLFGGRMQAGPRGNGFEVQVDLPWSEASR